MRLIRYKDGDRIEKGEFMGFLEDGKKAIIIDKNGHRKIIEVDENFKFMRLNTIKL